MTTIHYQMAFLILAGVLANLPWLSQRCFLVWECASKSQWVRLLEWLLLYGVIGLVAYALEHRVMGEVHRQEWEFYAVTLCAFMLLAVPGFIYRHIR